MVSSSNASALPVMDTVHSPRIMRIPSHRQSHSLQHLSPTSDYLTQSTDTMRSSSPQTLLSQRWLFISGEISSRQLSRDSVVALNRSLDEVENLLSWNAPGILWHKTAHFGLGITERSPADSPMILPETTPPDSTRAYAPDVVERPGSRIKESGDDQALLQRIASAVEQLRRRQEEFKVRCRTVLVLSQVY